jgi:hypothetical protein
MQNYKFPQINKYMGRGKGYCIVEIGIKKRAPDGTIAGDSSAKRNM